MDFRYNPGCERIYQRGTRGLSPEIKNLYEVLLQDVLVVKPALLVNAPPQGVIAFLEGALNAINLSLERTALWRAAGSPAVSIHVVCIPAHLPVFALCFELESSAVIVLPEEAINFHLYPSVLSEVGSSRIHEIRHTDLL